jgi:ribosomal protein S18 acetylase RimI-like enzyme
MTSRRATQDDAAVLSAFGRGVFGLTFAAENTPEDLQAYLDAAYTLDRQRDEVANPAIETLLVEQADALIGFAQLREGPPGEGVAGTRRIELWRFYVDVAWHGRGVARILMRAAEEAARRRAADTLWLGVWERNLRAQAFYRREGVAVVGAQIFHLGSDPQRDLIMAKSIEDDRELARSR